MPLEGSGSDRGGVSGSGLRSESVEGKFLILMRSVDSLRLGLRSVSASAVDWPEGTRKLDMMLVSDALGATPVSERLVTAVCLCWRRRGEERELRPCYTQ